MTQFLNLSRAGLCWLSVCLILFSLPLELQAQSETKIFGSDIESSNGFGYAVSLSGKRALVGAPGISSNSGPGAAYIFELQPDGSWYEVAKLTPDERVDLDFFGNSVAIDRNYAIIGARGSIASGKPATVYIFERQVDGTWLQAAKLMSTGDPFGDWYSRSVAISGKTAIVGARLDNGENGDLAQSGAAYIYERKANGTWVLAAKIRASDTGAAYNFGTSVSVYGDEALIGASGKMTDGVSAGGAYVFKRQPGGGWVESGILSPPDPAGTLGNLGQAVSLSYDRALVGDPSATVNGMLTTGLAYMYSKDASGEWQLDQEIIDRDVRGNARFGGHLAMDGDAAVIYAGNQLMNPKKFEPAVFVYKRGSNDRWQVASRLLASDFYTFDTNFGTTNDGATALSIDGSRAIVGAFGNDEKATNAGAAYIYELGGTAASKAGANDQSMKAYKVSNLPTEIQLFDNYPNPFNPTTNIRFALPEQSAVRLAVYDVTGREIERLVDGMLDAGIYDLSFEAGSLPGGLYLYRLETPAGSFTRKMVLLK